MKFFELKNNTKRVNQKKRGFTLIEIMVSISIFAVIMVTGIGALLSITRSYQTSRDHAITTNSIHFALDSMVRDLRLGDSYYAGDFSPLSQFPDEYRNLDDESYFVNFIGIPERGHMRYTFNPSSAPHLTRYQSVGGSASESPLLTEFDSIDIDNALFRVVGSDPSDDTQPSTFIYIKGIDQRSGSDFVLQTFVSQRNLDVQ